MGGIRIQQIYWFCFVDMTSVGQNCHIFTDLVSFSTISAGITAVLTLSTISLQSRTELPKVPTSISLQHIGNILAILARTIFWNILANNILEYSCNILWQTIFWSRCDMQRPLTGSSSAVSRTAWLHCSSLLASTISQRSEHVAASHWLLANSHWLLVLTAPPMI